MKVGDYGYVKGISRDYGIGKITQLNSGYSSNDGELIDIQFKHFKHSIPKNVISSPNIIDLIEVGDYVNGSKIIELATNIDGKILYLETDITEFDNVYACGNINIYEKDIKSVVTHEQFSQMEYRIGE